MLRAWKIRNQFRPFYSDGILYASIKAFTSEGRALLSAHPETPSPLAGEGRGEGDGNRNS